MYHFGMILQMGFTGQGNFTLRVGAHNRLTVRVVSKVFAKEVLLQVAVAMESFQAGFRGQGLAAKTEDALSGSASDGEGIGKTRPVQGGWRRPIAFMLDF